MAGTPAGPAKRGSQQPTVVLFDLDDTLLDVNSGWLWVRHEVALGRISVPLVLQAVYYMIIYALGWVENVDSAYKTAVRTYKGVPVAIIRAQTQKWFAEEVLPRTRPLARQVLERHRANGDLCVLASSTTQFAAECACAAYGLQDAVSSVLEVDADGALTGQVDKLAFGRAKLARVREWASGRGLDLSHAWFYSDSIADAPLLAEVGHPVCVNPDRKLRRLAQQRGWQIADWGHSPVPLVRRSRSGNSLSTIGTA